ARLLQGVAAEGELVPGRFPQGGSPGGRMGSARPESGQRSGQGRALAAANGKSAGHRGVPARVVAATRRARGVLAAIIVFATAMIIPLTGRREGGEKNQGPASPPPCEIDFQVGEGRNDAAL